jgi:hypothetical protein
MKLLTTMAIELHDKATTSRQVIMGLSIAQIHQTGVLGLDIIRIERERESLKTSL